MPNLATQIDEMLRQYFQDVVKGAVEQHGEAIVEFAERSRLIHEEATQQLLSLFEATMLEARIDELDKCIKVAGESFNHGRAMAQENTDGITYGVKEKYFKDRIAKLTVMLKEGKDA